MARARWWSILDRLLSILPGPPDDQAQGPALPGPDEPGIDRDTRLARLCLWRFLHEKQGHGGYR
jgi:hypothetical protein